jgi:hypothetical protein
MNKENITEASLESNGPQALEIARHEWAKISEKSQLMSLFTYSYSSITTLSLCC